jgi:hypothetical protein
MLPLSVSEKEKLGEPKEEIGNLKMDLNMYFDDLQIQYM